MTGKAKNKPQTNGEVWKEIRRQVEAGMPLAQAAREYRVGRSTVGRRAKQEGWKRPRKTAAPEKTESPAVPSAREDQAEVLEACEQAVTRALMRAAEGLMQAESDISKAMEPVDRALKLKRELAKESREQGNTTVVVETMVPEPSSE